MKPNRLLPLSLYAAVVLAIGGCNSGGGSSGSSLGSNSTPGTSSAATTVGAVSSGPITAFGSVFVNGHEFYTVGAKVVDDDTGSTSTSTAGLEVGEMVDVVPASNSTDADPIAAELHIDALARGYVDSSVTSAGTVTVMGQTVQINSNTVFNDHRACTTAATNPCTAVAGQSGLTATTGSGQAAVPGTYVTVYGYLFEATTSSSTTNIVASLVSVSDPPKQTSAPVNFKAEGVVNTVGNGSITIGGLAVDLSNARCFTRGRPQMQKQPLSCDGAFSTGQIVSAFGAAAPPLPAATFTADDVRLNKRIALAKAGATVELDGPVASVTSSPAAFVVRGISVDASQLPAGTNLPSVGDIVRVLGTVAADGQSITATSVTILHTASKASYSFEGDVGGITAGTAANTYVLTLLGQDILVTSNTRLADRSTTSSDDRQDPPLNPFNIGTFQSYLQASASQHVVVHASTDDSGNLTAQSVIIVRASTTAGVAGIVDASPAPANAMLGSGTPTTFSVHGVPVSADPAAVLQYVGESGHHNGHRPVQKTTTVAAGDQITALGTFDGTTLTVTAPPSFNNEVIDRGVPRRDDLEDF